MRDYRIAVGQATCQIVREIDTSVFKIGVHPVRLERVLKEGAVVESSRGLLDYWGGLTYAGLLLMPPTRHPFVHFNEAMRIKKKVQRRHKIII